MVINKNPFNLPTEQIDLPSKGLIYPTDHPLHSGKIEVVYPGARQEDILTNSNYLDKGIAIDKFLDSILISEVQMSDMIPGDKDAFMIGARILGLGKTYTTSVRIDKNPEPVSFDITTFKERELDWKLFSPGINEFPFVSDSGFTIKFKLLTIKDISIMGEEEAGEKKIRPDYSADTTLFLKHCITEANGSRDTSKIRDFVDRLLLKDSREIKKQILNVTPGYIWQANGTRQNKEVVEDLTVPFTADFFWPRL